MADITVSDVASLVKDYARNQNLTDARVIRAINTAWAFLQAQMGLPGTEQEYSFEYFEDKFLYSLPTYFGEELSIRFEDDELNARVRWRWKPGELLYERVKAYNSGSYLWGRYSAAGVPQAYILAKNSKSLITLDNFDTDNDTNWTASNDATNIEDDEVTKKEGAASLKFDVDVSASGNNRATLTRSITAQDLTDYKDVGHFRMWVYIPAITDLTSISFNWGSDGSNYYKVTVTTQDDGSAFAVGWNSIDFDWDGATVVGTPDDSEIDTIWIDVDYAAGYADASNWRFDYLRLVYPDTMIMTYYTTQKGEASGGSALETFTATTDKFLFGPWDPAVMELVALQAAVIINPQILVDDASVKSLLKQFIATFSRKYPKKKVNNLLADPQVAKTSHG